MTFSSVPAVQSGDSYKERGTLELSESFVSVQTVITRGYLEDENYLVYTQLSSTTKHPPHYQAKTTGSLQMTFVLRFGHSLQKLQSTLTARK